MDAKTVATLLAANRLLIGAGLTAAPGLATRTWIASHSRDDGARLMARAAGGRDVGLALGTLAALARRRHRWPSAAERRQRRQWLGAAALADGVDLLATLAAARALPPASVIFGASLAGASTLAHLWLRRELG